MLLCLFLGWLGIHRFWVSRYKSGFVQLLLPISFVVMLPANLATILFAVILLWWLLDIFTIIFGKFRYRDGTVTEWFSGAKNQTLLIKDSNQNIFPGERFKIPRSRIFILLLCLLFGWVGVHRFYVGRNITAFVQLMLPILFLVMDPRDVGVLFLPPLMLWWLIDTIIIIFGKFKFKDGTVTKWFSGTKIQIKKTRKDKKKSTSTGEKLSEDLLGEEIDICEDVFEKHHLRRIINKINNQLGGYLQDLMDLTNEYITGIFVIDINKNKFICVDIAFENKEISLDKTTWRKIATFTAKELNRSNFKDVIQRELGLRYLWKYDLPNVSVLCSSSGMIQFKIDNLEITK
jgi:TM2 domain-containing membrane protein YozV